MHLQLGSEHLRKPTEWPTAYRMQGSWCPKQLDDHASWLERQGTKLLPSSVVVEESSPKKGGTERPALAHGRDSSSSTAFERRFSDHELENPELGLFGWWRFSYSHGLEFLRLN